MYCHPTLHIIYQSNKQSSFFRKGNAYLQLKSKNYEQSSMSESYFKTWGVWQDQDGRTNRKLAVLSLPRCEESLLNNKCVADDNILLNFQNSQMKKQEETLYFQVSFLSDFDLCTFLYPCEKACLFAPFVQFSCYLVPRVPSVHLSRWPSYPLSFFYFGQLDRCIQLHFWKRPWAIMYLNWPIHIF